MDNTKFRKLLSLKYPIILIDEYQDSLKIVVDQFLKYFTRKRSVMVNFFHVTNEFFILFSIQNPDFCAFFV